MPERNNTSRTNRTRQCRRKARRRENALRAPATLGHGQRVQRQSAPSPRKTRRERPKSAISHDKCLEPALSAPDTRIFTSNLPHDHTAEGYTETLFVLFAKTSFPAKIRIVFSALTSKMRATRCAPAPSSDKALGERDGFGGQGRAVTHSRRRGAPRGTTRVARFGNAARR